MPEGLTTIVAVRRRSGSGPAQRSSDRTANSRVVAIWEGELGRPIMAGADSAQPRLGDSHGVILGAVS